MIEWTKKNIKGIIDILKIDDIKGREALQTMRICRDGFAYVSNGYVAIRWKLESEPVPRDENQKEFVIPLDKLIVWYKLHDAKDKLNEITILELQDENNTTVYPDMARLFRQTINTPESKSCRVNLDLIKQVHNATDCRNYMGYKMSFHNNVIYMEENKRKHTEMLVMGLEL